MVGIPLSPGNIPPTSRLPPIAPHNGSYSTLLWWVFHFIMVGIPHSPGDIPPTSRLPLTSPHNARYVFHFNLVGISL